MDTSFFLATVFGTLFVLSIGMVYIVIFLFMPLERGQPRNALAKDWRWYYVRWIEESIQNSPNNLLVMVSDGKLAEPMYITVQRSEAKGVLQAGCFVRSFKKDKRRVYEFSKTPCED